MHRSLPVYIFLIALLIGFTVPSPAHSYTLAGGVHDRTNDPAFLASNVPGICAECHIPHGAYEIRLWGRDLVGTADVDDLCVDCHDGDGVPAWASSAQDVSKVQLSYHDFSSIAAVAPRGACSACHDLHAPNDNTAAYVGSDTGHYYTNFVLWKRDLSGELTEFDQKRDLNKNSDPSGGPNYLIGTTVFCYDCHGGDARQGQPVDSDFDINKKPQDIAFAGDRNALGGTVGYYELPTGEEPGGSGAQAPSLSSVLNSDSVPGGHYVKSWMNNDGIPEDDNYEVRDPDNNLLYKISIGDKLPCELCHDPHKGEISTADDDEVFFRRKILAGEESIVENNDNYFSGVIFKASPNSRAGGAGENDGTGREMCQWCHGSSDWTGSTGSSTTGINPLIVDTIPNIVTVYGIKVRTAVQSDGSQAFPPPLGPPEHTSADTTPCTNCHNHNNVNVNACNGCHGGGDSGAENYWPDSTPQPPTFPDNTGAHNDHVTIIQARNTLPGVTAVERQNATCDWCHPDPGGVNVDGAIHRTNTVGSAGTTADLNQDTFNSTTYFKNLVPLMGTYDISGPAGTATYNQTTGQCSNLYCHGDYLGGGNASPTWGSTASGGCGTCHPDDSSHVSGSHSKHVGTAAGEYGTRILCTDCHLDVSGAGAATHWDVMANSTINSSYGSAAAYSPTSHGGTPAVGDTYGGCNAVDCHGASMPSGAAGADTTPVWGDASTGQCGDCHYVDGSPGITSGSHTLHLDSGAGVYGSNIRYDCTRCHNLVDTADNDSAEINSVNNHADMGTDIDFDSFNAGARTYQATGADQCGSLYCHGNFTGGNTNNVATWGSQVSGNCGTCHGSDANATPTSGSHTSHFDSIPNGPNAGCNDCHGAGAVTATHADHVDGTITMVSSVGYVPSTDTCTGTNLGLGCHNWYDTPAWGSAADCTDCHQADAPPDDFDGDPFSALHYVAPAFPTVQAHDQNLWVGTMGGQSGCETCHSSGPSDLHYNGVVQYSADTINFASSVNFADSTIPTCAPDGGNYTGCHSD